MGWNFTLRYSGAQTRSFSKIDVDFTNSSGYGLYLARGSKYGNAYLVDYATDDITYSVFY